MPSARFFVSSLVRLMVGLARMAPAYATRMCEAMTISSGAAGAGAAVGAGGGAGAAVAAAAERSGGGVTAELEAGSVRSAQELAPARRSRQDSSEPVFIGAYTYGARRRSCKVFRAPGSGG